MSKSPQIDQIHDELAENEEEFASDDFSDDEPVHYTGEGAADIRRMSKSDAISLVGGHSVLHASTENIPDIAEDDQLEPSNYNGSQKTFSFSLPFGGFSRNITHSLTKRLPFTSDEDSHFTELKQEMELKLERQQSISTVDETNYFKNVTSTDNVRMRAVKSSFSFLNFKKKDYDTIYNEISGNILVLGGFRGSVLKDTKTNKRLWVPFKAGMHLSKANLFLGPNDEDELNATDLIYPSDILSHIGPIDIMRKFIRKLKANGKANVTEWPYDWRLSGEVISDQLYKKLTEIYENTGKPTLVIGHSMGGLVSHGTLQRAPHLFRGLIYVGTPTECCNVLGPIRYGDSVLLSDKILTFETNFMMRSAFMFLPLDGRIFTNLETQEFYDLDYFDPETWVEFNLNPLVAKKRLLHEKKKKDSSPGLKNLNLDSQSTLSSITTLIKKSWKNASLSPRISSPFSDGKSESTDMDDVVPDWEDYDYSLTFSEAYDYLSRSLSRAKKYIHSLEWREDLEDKYPPLAVVYGNKVPSVRGSNVRSLQDIKDGTYDEFFYGHGDGVVHQRNLMPERRNFKFYDESTGKGEIVGKFPSDCGHVNLMTDFKAMGQALHAIVEAEKNWKNKK